MTRKSAAPLLVRPHEPALAFSVKEAADIVGISRAKAYQLLSEGSLQSIKIGRRRLVPRSAVEALVRQGA